ncbi:CPCC family cysteine-rich protein [Priestia megaterium]|uniref:CPCC family cysteine-rich protein n=1 Tax=Priestia megaterium TaxID=1404 RepID=UPI0025B04CF6|nr:CPCC family cysteine-rich protein [Priestia megaterium]MDN3232684.1 CPCC family cysteine-rich protein [Priestia megaterium]
MRRVPCPCCEYLTLENANDYEICILCNWEDDGQDDPHADEIWGGPNGEYSLTQARINFKKHNSMYDISEYKTSVEKENIKMKLINAFEKLNFNSLTDKEEVWKEINHYENALLNEKI